MHARPLYELPGKEHTDRKQPLQTTLPYNVAHRGSNGEFPEETAAAYLVLGDQDLRERHFGALQGHVYQELAKLTPKAYEALKSHRTDQEIPGGGESRDQLYKRCTTALQRIGEKHRGQRVIVVSHGGVIRSLFNRADVKGQHSGKISNTSVETTTINRNNCKQASDHKIHIRILDKWMGSMEGNLFP